MAMWTPERFNGSDPPSINTTICRWRMLRIAAFFFFFRFSQCGHRRSSSWNILFSSAAQVEALPDWKKLKQVSVSMARTLIARPTSLKLYDTTVLASGRIQSPRLLQNRDISIRMVLLKLETEPGQQLMANCWSKKEIPTWEVRTRKPQWIPGGTECHQTEPPLLQLHHLLIGNHILSPADPERLWWPFVWTLTTLIFTS